MKKRTSLYMMEDTIRRLGDIGLTIDNSVSANVEYATYMVNQVKNIGMHQLRKMEEPFTLEEYCLFASIMNGVIYSYNIHPYNFLINSISESLVYEPYHFETWNIDQDKLLAKLGKIDYLEAIAIIFACNKFWETCKPKMDIKIELAKIYGIKCVEGEEHGKEQEKENK